MGTSVETGLLPVRMLNEFTYCPRLFHLEHVEGLFLDNADTVEGQSVHRRVDRTEEPPPDTDGEDPPRVARSVSLSSARLGLVAKIDLVEVAGDLAVPVDTKKGRAPDLPEGAWEPERVQLCAQGLLLRENGYRCEHGFLYFAGSRRRVRIDLGDDLVRRTLELAAAAREAVQRSVPPPPLEDSPKCPRCSLVGICLPDEVNTLRAEDGAERRPERPRRLIAARTDRVPVYVQGHGLQVSKSGGKLVIKERGAKVRDVLLKDVSHVALFGNNQVTTPALRALLQEDVPVSYFSHGGWFYGMTRGLGLKNVLLRREQFRVADREVDRLALARRFVVGKITNQRTLLMRNHPEPPPRTVAGLKKHVQLAEKAETVEVLLGIEGNAARLYFQELGAMLKPRGGASAVAAFDFETRNRRPPKDPVNSMLSFGYAVLAKDATIALHAVGFDPFVGFFHSLRPGRAALALDLMEEFRPLVVDSVVLTVVNNGEATADGFVVTTRGCTMKPPTRKALLGAYERRMDTLVTHPVFDYRLSYRRVLELQARLLAAVVQGELDRYTPFTTR